MWKGILQGYMMDVERREREADREESRRIREEDMALRREQFETTRLDNYRKAVLPILLENQEKDRAIQQSINSGVAIGFNRPVSEALYRSGQLAPALAFVEANNHSPERIAALNAAVENQLGELADTNTVAATLMGVIDKGTDLTNPQETTLAIVQSVFETQNIEDIQSMTVGSRFSEGLPPFDVSFRTTEVDVDLEKKVRDGIMRRLQGAFGPNIIVSNENGFNFAANAPVALTDMVNDLTDAAFDAVRSTGSDAMDDVTAIRYFTNPVMEAYKVVPDVTKVSAALPTLFEAGPQAFIETISAIEMPEIPVPGDNPMGDAMTAMTGGTPGATSGQPTDFNSLIDEELNR
jgi:hypothetical protein